MWRCLVVDDQPEVQRFCIRALEALPDVRVDAASDGREGLARCREVAYDVVLTDVMMPGGSGLDFLKGVKAEQPSLEVVVMTGHGTIARALDAIRAGAAEFLEKPLSVDLLHLVVGRCLERVRLRQEIDRLRRSAQAPEGLGRIVGRSPRMQALFTLLKTVAEVDSTVLILGETGTGKELVARELHEASARRDGPFVAVACAAIPETLLESELFGHEKGAFTGASRARVGKFEAAHGGTIFLDEIGEVPLSMQHRLLRVIQERHVDRLGGGDPIMVDVRVVAATHRDLAARVRAGAFREDLFYRLDVLPLHVPALRDRREDIPLLASHFVARFAERFKKPVRGIEPKAMHALLAHDWPGNVRELEHAIERAVVLSTGADLTEVLRPTASPATVRADASEAPSGGDATPPDISLSFEEASRLARERAEAEYLRALLTFHRGRLNTAAAAAGMNSRSLYAKMRQYGLRKEDFKSVPRFH